MMKIMTRSANPSDKVAGWDTYGLNNNVGEVTNVSEIRDGQFASIDTWTPVDMYFKTALPITNTQIRMKSYNNVRFQVDRFIINKLDDTASLVVQAESISGSLTGTFTNEGIQCVVGNPINFATYGTSVALDSGKYNILVYIKQLQAAVTPESSIFTFKLSCKKDNIAYDAVTKTFTQSDFPSIIGEYKAFSIPVEVPQGSRITESQLMVKFEGNTDIIIDKFEILPAIVFNSFNVSSNHIITNLVLGTSVAGIKGVITPSVATVVCNKADATMVGTGTTLAVTLNGYSDTYTAVIYGDVDGDGAIGLEDLTSIKSHMLHINLLTGTYKTAGDVFASGTVSISDLMAVKKSVMGLGAINQNPLG